MRGALAYDWDFSEENKPDEKERDKKEPERVAAAPATPESPSGYSTYFARSTQPSYTSYQYRYDQTLPSRRPAFTLPAFMEKGLALFVQHWLTLAGVGLLLFVWILLGGLISHFTQQEKPQIYSFTGGVVAPPPAPTASGLNVNGGSLSVLGSPSINPARIETILKQYNSPALGTGQAMYDLGVRYGIDPAFALAFFIHESSAGTRGVAVSTKSIGNIRCTPGYQCLQTEGNGSFRKYSSWEAGMEDWYKLIKELYIGKWGLKTLGQIIPVYAPSADRNNPAQYIQHVAQMVEGWKTGNSTR